MKKVHLVLLLIITSCTYFQTKQQRAERLAKIYLDSVLTGSDKYELINAGKIDTMRAGPDNEPDYQLISSRIDSTHKIGDSLNRKMADPKNHKIISTLQKSAEENFNKRNVLLHQSLEYLFNYKGKPMGWLIEQTYLSKKDNSKYFVTFKFDNNVTQVLSQETTKE